MGAAAPAASAAEAPHGPPQQGSPHRPQRHLVDLRTGSPWRALAERYGSWKTVSSRFYRWQRTGIWSRVLAALQRQADIEGRLDWSLHFVDSTVVRAHQHAAGAEGGARSPKHLVGAAAGTARRFIFGVSAAVGRWSSC